MLGLAIDFIGRDVNKLLHSHFHCRFKHYMCATDVGFCECEGVTEAEVDVRLSGEVEDGIYVVLFKAAKDSLFVGHVAEYELEVGTRRDAFGVVH